MFDYQLTPAIEKDLKKIRSKELRKRVAAGIHQVRTDPLCGSPKTGSLRGLIALRIDEARVSYRLGYYFEKERNMVVFVLFDSRERFYQRAKRLFG